MTNSSLKINSITHPLNAAVCVPGSKSLTNRALLIASLANGTTHLTNALFSDDSRYFAKAMQTLGFDVQLDEANFTMTVKGLGGKILKEYAQDLRAHYARHAQAVLKEETGRSGKDRR